MAYIYPNRRIWELRKDALLGRIGALSSRYEKSNLPRRATLSILLQGLQSFSECYFDYFYKGFASEPGKKLKRSDEYPPEHVLSVALSQIGYDLEVIERAMMQRLEGTDFEKQALEKTDALAWNALQLVKDKLKKSDVTSLTYFHKSPNIRVMPYAKVMLIGVPYTVTMTSMDYLAIPHEVGHYVFWNRESTQEWWRNNVAGAAELCGDEAKQAFRVWWLKTSSDWKPTSSDPVQVDAELDKAAPAHDARPWWEELFADVYAALIAGPIEAMDFQEQALHNSRKGFLELKDEHPSPVLRPRIFNKVLAARRDWGDMPEKLDEHWRKQIDEHWQNQQLPPMDGWMGEQLGLDPGGPVDQLIALALKMLSGVHSDWFRSSAGLSVEELSKQMEQMENPIDEIVKKAAEQAPTEAEEAKIVTWDEWNPASEITPTTVEVPEGNWLPVFKADDWTTGGGENDPAH